MVKVEWFPGDDVARMFRDSNSPGIIFVYDSAWTREDEAITRIKELKNKNVPYRKQVRTSSPNITRSNQVHVIFKGVPKNQAMNRWKKRGK